MGDNGFVADVRHMGEVAVIDLGGDLDGTAERLLTEAWESVGDAHIVALNFSGASYINSTGIALIVGLLGRARVEKKVVRAFGLTDHYREIFEITRLCDFIELHQDEEQATVSP
jgi:anti-anti-sigma factor